MPPPGFGPKIDKKKQEEAKALIPESERYSIRLDRKEEDVLRQVLCAAQAHSSPATQKLLREQKKLHQMYSQLTRLGFSTESAEACLPHVRTDWTLSDALDWCCLHLPEVVLPPAFKLSRIGEGTADEVKEGGKRSRERQAIALGAAGGGKDCRSALPDRVAAKDALRVPVLPAVDKPKTKARVQDRDGGSGDGSAAEFNKRFVAAMMVGGSSEEEDELTDALGVLELGELDNVAIKQVGSAELSCPHLTWPPLGSC